MPLIMMHRTPMYQEYRAVGRQTRRSCRLSGVVGWHSAGGLRTPRLASILILLCLCCHPLGVKECPQSWRTCNDGTFPVERASSRGCVAQLVRALPLQGRCPGFESLRTHFRHQSPGNGRCSHHRCSAMIWRFAMDCCPFKTICSDARRRFSAKFGTSVANISPHPGPVRLPEKIRVRRAGCSPRSARRSRHGRGPAGFSARRSSGR